MTPLDKPLRRELAVGDQRYTLLIDPQGLKITLRGHRQGVALAWSDLINGDAQLAAALNASTHEGGSS
ncbi:MULTISPECIES: hypothetical protein [Dyella]|uniref:Uncharacterized protein n=2 Tax=Dyella TaxID=231454 RepID=A0A4R0Z1C4_9GAMM|nr:MULTISPECIES: hypothetical protein [Dyella]TBR39448.1 hypothetical protein EYV96_04335 [Dyella terrae]TCI12966.1 hypothetical protein EZM97_06530 [Dyella soli]